MSPDYGKKVFKAFGAIRQIYKDSSKLLADCDGTIGKGRPFLFGNKVMRDTSRVLSAPDNWMPAYLYRYYDMSRDGSGLVDAILIHFWDPEEEIRSLSDGLPDEPMLILGRIKYRKTSKRTSIKSRCEEWDLWNLAFHFWDDFKVKKVGKVDVGNSESEDAKRIEWARVWITPLYEIESVEQVEELMKKVRDQSPR